MNHLVRILTAVPFLFLISSCGSKKTIKDISELLPDKIELRTDQVKDLSFSIDSTSNSRLIKFSDLDLPANTVLYFSRKDSATIRYTGKEVLDKDSVSAIIPCCRFKDFYRNVPLIVPYEICFYSPEVPDMPPLGVRDESNKPLPTEIVTVRSNQNRIRLSCLSGWIQVMATVECFRCQGYATFCGASYELFGTTYGGSVSVPPLEYRIGTSSSNLPCGVCPDHPQCPSTSPVK